MHNQETAALISKIDGLYCDPVIYAKSFAEYYANQAKVLSELQQCILELSSLVDDEGQPVDLGYVFSTLAEQEPEYVLNEPVKLFGDDGGYFSPISITDNVDSDLPLSRDRGVTDKAVEMIKPWLKVCMPTGVNGGSIPVTEVIKASWLNINADLTTALPSITDIKGQFVSIDNVTSQLRDSLADVQCYKASFIALAESAGTNISDAVSMFNDRLEKSMRGLSSSQLAGRLRSYFNESLGSLKERVYSLVTDIHQQADDAIREMDQNDYFSTNYEFADYTGVNSVTVTASLKPVNWAEGWEKVKQGAMKAFGVVKALAKAAWTKIKQGYVKYVAPLVTNPVFEVRPEYECEGVDVPLFSVQYKSNSIGNYLGKERGDQKSGSFSSWSEIIENMFNKQLNDSDFFAACYDCVGRDSAIHMRYMFFDLYFWSEQPIVSQGTFAPDATIVDKVAYLLSLHDTTVDWEALIDERGIIGAIDVAYPPDQQYPHTLLWRIGDLRWILLGEKGYDPNTVLIREQTVHGYLDDCLAVLATSPAINLEVYPILTSPLHRNRTTVELHNGSGTTIYALDHNLVSGLSAGEATHFRGAFFTRAIDYIEWLFPDDGASSNWDELALSGAAGDAYILECISASCERTFAYAWLRSLLYSWADDEDDAEEKTAGFGIYQERYPEMGDYLLKMSLIYDQVYDHPWDTDVLSGTVGVAYCLSRYLPVLWAWHAVSSPYQLQKLYPSGSLADILAPDHPPYSVANRVAHLGTIYTHVPVYMQLIFGAQELPASGDLTNQSVFEYVNLTAEAKFDVGQDHDGLNFLATPIGLPWFIGILGAITSNQYKWMKEIYQSIGEFPVFIPYERIVSKLSCRFHLKTSTEIKEKADAILTGAVTVAIIAVAAAAAVFGCVYLKRSVANSMARRNAIAEGNRYNFANMSIAKAGNGTFKIPTKVQNPDGSFSIKTIERAVTDSDIADAFKKYRKSTKSANRLSKLGRLLGCTDWSGFYDLSDVNDQESAGLDVSLTNNDNLSQVYKSITGVSFS